MAQLAINGHATRGEEVIEILEMLGGSNPHNYSADCSTETPPFSTRVFR